MNDGLKVKGCHGFRLGCGTGGKKVSSVFMP